MKSNKSSGRKVGDTKTDATEPSQKSASSSDSRKSAPKAAVRGGYYTKAEKAYQNLIERGHIIDTAKVHTQFVTELLKSRQPNEDETKRVYPNKETLDLEYDEFICDETTGGGFLDWPANTLCWTRNERTDTVIAVVKNEDFIKEVT